MIANIIKYKWFILIGAILIIFIALAYTYGMYHPSPNSAVIQEYVKAKLIEEKTKYNDLIKKKNDQIIQLNKDLEKSQKVVSQKQTEIKNLKNQMTSIKAPQNLIEIRQRLLALGYQTK